MSRNPEFGDGERKKYRRLLGMATDALFAVDADGRFETANETFLDLVGYDRTELLGTPVGDVLHPDDASQWERQVNLLRTETSEESDTWSARLVTKNGTEAPVTLQLSLIPAEDGEYAGIVGRASDVRERQRREQKLNILNRTLRHNIRNRMNLILGHAVSLQDVDDEGYRTDAEQIEAVGEEIITLSDKARKAHKHLDIPPDEDCRVDLVELTEQVVTTFEISYPNAEVTTDLPDRAPARAPPSYETALVELLENAVVHHPSENGPVTVEIVVEERVAVRVHDECGPIPQSVADCLDEGEQPLQHNDGMGLWIVKWVVEIVGGDLSFARRDDDSGNTVTLTFDAIGE